MADDAPRDEGLDEAPKEPGGEPAELEEEGATVDEGGSDESEERPGAEGEGGEVADGDASEDPSDAQDEGEADSAAGEDEAEGGTASPGYEAAFTELEAQVRAAAAELAKLRRAKRKAAREARVLRERVARLEEGLEAEPSGSAETGDGPSVRSVRAAWEEERAEVRRRVAALAGRLEDLLAEEEET